MAHKSIRCFTKLCLAFAAVFLPFSAFAAQIDGQIFLRTEDGSSVKLSLTDVYVLDQESASRVLHQMEGARDKRITSLKTDREKLEAEHAKFMAESQPTLIRQQRLRSENEKANTLVREKLDALVQLVPSVSEIYQDGPNVAALKAERRERGMGELKALQAKAAQSAKEIHLSKEQIKKGLAAGENLEQALDSARTAEKEAQNLSLYASDVKDVKTLAKVTSDADGKFTTTAPSDVVLFAFSSRAVKGETQTHCWLVIPSPTEHLIMLTNRNTIDTSAPENFVAAHNN